MRIALVLLISVCACLSPVSHAVADGMLWSPLFSRGGSDCFIDINKRQPTAVLAPRNDMLSIRDGDRPVPVAMQADRKTRVPECSTALFAGTSELERFAISNTQAYIGRLKTPLDVNPKWKKLIDFKDRKLGLHSPRFAIQPADRVVAWVGWVPVQEGYNQNHLVIWNLPNKDRHNVIGIGGGYAGMSGVAFLPNRKEILVASTHGCATLQSFDYEGRLVGKFPGINAALYAQRACLSFADSWEWGIDLASDAARGELLMRLSGEFASDGKARLYRLDPASDRLMSVEIAP